MRIILSAAAILFFQTVNAQNNNKVAADTIQHITLDTLEISAPPGPPPYQSAAAKSWDIIHTKLAISFNYKEKTAACREWIILHPWAYDQDSLVLDAKSMQIDSVALQNTKQKKALRFSYYKDKLTIYFEKKYASKDTINLALQYVAMPYKEKTGGSTAITDDRGLYFINSNGQIPGKPVQIWTQGETEANSHWLITIDKPNTRFTTELEITVPDSFVSLSNGLLVKQTKGKYGIRTDYWKMDKPIQAYVVMMAVGKFSIIREQWEKKEVSYYVEPAFAPVGGKIFANTPEMITCFSIATGVPYAWPKYSQVVVRDYVSGAMENTSASLFGEFMNQTSRELMDRFSDPEKNNEDVISHELFHQWFGDLATCESWSNITVNESFANYGEQIWRKYKYGKSNADELAWKDLQAYIMTSRFKDPQLVRFNYDTREEVFDAISYNKGGAVLRYLNGLLGDELFSRAMKTYLTKNAYQSAEAHNWRLAVEEVTGQDWNWFFNQWYFHAGHPILRITYKYDDTASSLHVIVKQEASSDSNYSYQLPLKSMVIYGDVKKVEDWQITKKETEFIYPYSNGQKPVIVPDVEHWLPGEIRESKTPINWLLQFKASGDYVSRLLAVNGAAKQISDTNAQTLLTLALSDEMPSIRIAALNQMQLLASDRYHKKWRTEVQALATNQNVGIRAAAVHVLAAWKDDESTGILLNALRDSSYIVSGYAMEGFNKINKDTAYILASELVKSPLRGNLESQVLSIVGKKGKPEDVAIFKKLAFEVSGRRKSSFMLGLNSYIKNVKEVVPFTQAVDLYLQLAKFEEVKNNRRAFAGYLFEMADGFSDEIGSDNKEDSARATEQLAYMKKIVKDYLDFETDKDLKIQFEKSFNKTFANKD